jgi:hypothetical protein
VIDLYCERVDPGFWSEPVNALTNAAFLVAAVLAWRLRRRYARADATSAVLILLVALIGIGSFLFHTLADTWSAAADVTPIVAFQLLYLWYYGGHMLGWQRRGRGLAVAVLLGAMMATAGTGQVLNGSLAYLPALLSLFLLGILHRRVASREPALLLLTAGLFAMSLALRTLDPVLCPAWPLGTHFLWHLANAVVLYLALRAVLTHSPRHPGGC